MPNLAKPAELQKLIDAYEKSSETKAVAYVSEELAGGKPIYEFGQKRCELYKFANETVMLPKVTPVEPPPKVEESPIAKKLRELDGLFNQKLITQEEYETKRKEILSSM